MTVTGPWEPVTAVKDLLMLLDKGLGDLVAAETFMFRIG